jgi:hypothetical protein
MRCGFTLRTIRRIRASRYFCALRRRSTRNIWMPYLCNELLAASFARMTAEDSIGGDQILAEQSGDHRLCHYAASR